MSTAGETLKNVELFASGNYRGRTYTDDEIDRIAATGKKLGELGILRPPAVKGHEEEAADGSPTAAPERTDVPADGWVNTASLATRLKWDPLAKVFRKVLVGTLENVPAAMAEDIRRRRFRKVSAEVYDDFKDDSGGRHGPALRRVAFLGGEVPQVKLLADLPMPVAGFGELRPATATKTTAGTWLTFSEVADVDEQNKAAVLAAMPGLNPASLQALPPDVLADLAKNCPPPVPLPMIPPTPVAPAPVAPMADPAVPAFDKAGAIAKLVAAGAGDEATLSTKTDADLQAMVAALPAPVVAPMADTPPADDPTKKKPDGVTANSEADRLQKIALDKLRRQNAEMKANAINAFCETAKRTGQMVPAQEPFMRLVLSYIPDSTYETFTEAGKTVTATPLDRVLAAGKSLPTVFRFNERVPEAGANDPGTKKTAAVAKATEFATVHAESFKAAGISADGFVKKFSEQYDKDPAGALKSIQ